MAGLVETATQQLRNIYHPCELGHHSQSLQTGKLVAVDGDTLVGTAEYIVRNTDLYIQGIAVHPKYRRQGVCRSLLTATEKLARVAKLEHLALSVIEETGNVMIFERLGFKIKQQALSSAYVSPRGDAVTQVDMTRRIA